jgi:hypothetical protein
MTMRGTPQFFYGTEVLMTNDKAGSDGQRRSDFYGGWKGDSKNAVTEIGLTNEEKKRRNIFLLYLTGEKRVMRLPMENSNIMRLPIMMFMFTSAILTIKK